MFIAPPIIITIKATILAMVLPIIRFLVSGTLKLLIRPINTEN